MTRPKLNLPFSKSDKTLILLSLILVLFSFIAATYFYMNAPEEVAIHFDANMDADNYGGRIHLFAVPTIGLLLFLLIRFTVDKPHWYNYGVRITEENAEFEYSRARKLLLIVLFATCLLLFYVSLFMGFSTQGVNIGSAWLFWCIAGGMVIGPPIWYFSRSKSK